jgi:hypothetical protein
MSLQDQVKIYSDRGVVDVPPGTLVVFGGALAISAGYAPIDGGRQPFVTINTEGLPAAHVSEDGDPLMMVDLNDSSLYDDEGDGDRSAAGADRTALDGIAEILNGGSGSAREDLDEIYELVRESGRRLNG